LGEDCKKAIQASTTFPLYTFIGDQSGCEWLSLPSRVANQSGDSRSTDAPLSAGELQHPSSTSGHHPSGLLCSWKVCGQPGQCAMDRHATGLHHCQWSTAALRGGARWIGMPPARTAANGQPLRCAAVRNGSACRRLHRCQWSTAALRGGARWIGMPPARTAADGQPLRCGAVRDGSGSWLVWRLATTAFAVSPGFPAATAVSKIRSPFTNHHQLSFSSRSHFLFLLGGE